MFATDTECHARVRCARFRNRHAHELENGAIDGFKRISGQELLMEV